MKRQPITARTRYEVLRRDNYACRYCGSPSKLTPLQIDHVIPVRHGGDNRRSNLVAACQPCNAGKSALLPTPEFVAEIRADEVAWESLQKRHVYGCIYCGEPQYLEDGDEDPVGDCSRCSDAVCEAYDAGHRDALGLPRRKRAERP